MKKYPLKFILVFLFLFAFGFINAQQNYAFAIWVNHKNKIIYKSDIYEYSDDIDINLVKCSDKINFKKKIGFDYWKFEQIFYYDNDQGKYISSSNEAYSERKQYLHSFIEQDYIPQGYSNTKIYDDCE